jgi:cysteinyl-tRNA synthetase
MSLLIKLLLLMLKWRVALMMKNELEQSLKTTLTQIEELKKKAEEIIEELKKEEIPLYPEFEKGSAFSYMNIDLSVQATEAAITETTQDYNAFHSEHYAEMLAERSNYLAMLLHCKWYFDRDYEPDWDNPNEIKWTVGDVKTAFVNEYGRLPSEGELKDCVENVAVKTLEEVSIERGWDIINEAII